MKKIALTVITLTLVACTQPVTPPPAATPATPDAAKGQEAPAIAATTPILSLLVGNAVNAAVKGSWCLKDGAAPFTKISVQDESVAAPLPNVSVSKDTPTAQAPGTARLTTQASDSQFHIQWLSSGLKGDADLALQGDTLTFADENDKATFTHCQ